MQAGWTYVHGRDRETAQMLLKAARDAGVHPHLVRATDEGFLVPDEVWDEAEKAQTPSWVEPDAVF